MFGRKKKQSGSGHIKDNTFGSSNEISFSVLDAKKRSAESDDEKDARSQLGRISLFTLGKAKKPSSTPKKDKIITMPSESSDSGKSASLSSSRSSDKQSAPSAPAWEYSQQEVTARKSRRRRGKALFIVLVVLAVLAALAVGGYFAVKAIQHQMDFIGQLDEQIVNVESQRENMQPFIDLVNDASEKPIDQLDYAYQSATMDAQRQKLDECDAKLKMARKEIERIQEHLVAPGDKERSNDALVSINALLNMIEIGTKIMDESMVYTKDMTSANGIMALLIEADAAARDAASLGSGSTQEAMQQSIEKSNEAIAKFQEASALAAAIRDEGKIDGMQLFIDYIGLRISAQESAIKADNAFLSVNSADLATFGDEYNAKEAEAVELFASADGVYPPQLVTQAFDAWRTGNETIASWKSYSTK